MSTRKSATEQRNQGFDESTLQQQHRALKSRYPSALLLFRIGEGYEAYGDDAINLHRVLGLHIANNINAPDNMRSQVRFEAAELDGYLTGLVKAGHKVAVCDQLQDPPTFRGPDAMASGSDEAAPVEPHPASAGAISKEGIFQRIDPLSIHISPFQHRTVFDPVEMEELRKDIAKNGVHTALIARKQPGIEGAFELVAGECRLRIACELTLPEVPVCIREMTDRQVKELQWSENFRRVNPDPLDEAAGLNQMLEYHKTVDGLARYLVKPKAYLLTRLTLLNLIPAIREMVHARVFNLRDSLDLATLDQKAQKSFFDEYCSEWKSKKTFRLRDLSSTLTKFRRDLSRAIFDPKDKGLVPEAGACTHCPYNSATYHSLFPETEKKSSCNRQACFENKCVAQLRRKLSEAIAEYQPTALVSIGSIGKRWQALLDELPEIAALPRYSYHDIYTACEPTEPDRDDYGYDDEEEGIDEEGYAEALNEYHAEKEEFEQGLREGKLHKGLFLQTDSVSCVLFDTERQRTHGTPTVTATAAAVQHAIKAGTATPELLQGEMTRITQREKRNCELDLEKIQKAVHDSFTAKLAGEDALPETTAQDQVGIRLFIYQALNYSAKADLHERYPYAEKKEGTERCPLTQWLTQLTEAQVAFMTRLAIRCHKEVANPLSETGDALRLIAEGIGVDVTGIRAAQEKVAATRNSRANDRLSALQKRVEASQTKEIPADTATVAA
jgi:ParB family transcriptional regulator, chromosome partitioning protein